MPLWQKWIRKNKSNLCNETTIYNWVSKVDGVGHFLRKSKRESGNLKEQDMRYWYCTGRPQHDETTSTTSIHLRNSKEERKMHLQFLESFSAATDGRHDRRVVDIDDAGRGERRSVRHVRHEKVNRFIRVHNAKRVFAKRNRQPRAFQHRFRLRPRFRRIVRVAWCRFRFRGCPDTAPYVARAFAV